MAVLKSVKYDVIKTNNVDLISPDSSELSFSILEKSGNYVVHKDVNRKQQKQKQGTVSTKTRSEVRGGGRKPWRQKGTGRARAGSNRSPLWKGGGVIFGPKPKKVNLKLNKKERRLALQTLLYSRQRDICVIENIENILENSKTKTFTTFCQMSDISLDKKILIIVSEKTSNLKLSTRNIKNIELISTAHLNTLSLLKAKKIYITNHAIIKIKEIFCA